MTIKITPIAGIKFHKNSDGKQYIVIRVEENPKNLKQRVVFRDIANNDINDWRQMPVASFKKYQPRLIQIIEEEK